MVDNFYYDHIAKDYDLKRKKPWKALQRFFFYLENKNYFFNGTCVDLGCGNGRHFEIFLSKANRIVGIDNSLEFLKIARDNLKREYDLTKLEFNRIQLLLADIRYMPIRSCRVNLVFSIASFHHLKTEQGRIKALSEIFTSLGQNGYFLLTVWRRWQKKLRRFFITDWFKRKFSPKHAKKQRKMDLNEFGDKFVRWTLSKENKTFNRFYHFFSKREILKLLKKFVVKEFKKLGGSTNEDNFFILAQKQSEKVH
ncbi:MAG: class I SAM-dependent methyltransferase [Promethearchaeota archaeon]|nr:MAG: class I SAM-dependent methyltransferase [Candidatus Lokiarchaeota archaeon]